MAQAIINNAYSVNDFSNTLNWGDPSYIYVRPWNRMGPYFVGMLAAMAWLHFKGPLLESARRHTLGTLVAWLLVLQWRELLHP